MTTTTEDRPGAINARPVRHPWRWVAIAVIVVLLAMVVSSFLTNPRWDFGFAFQIMQQKPVINGLWTGTIFGTIVAMTLGVGLGVALRKDELRYITESDLADRITARLPSAPPS